MNHLELASRFRRWRVLTRTSVTVGTLLLIIAWRWDGGSMRVALVVAGFMLFVATFPMYLIWCNRCPRCRKSFSNAPEYASDESSGLPLFNRIAKCPFCSLDLDEGRRHF